MVRSCRTGLPKARCGAGHRRTACRAGRSAGREDCGMALSFELDPTLTDELRSEIIRLWAEVTNAGGAVGFVAPVTVEDVRPTADAAFAGVEARLDHLLVGF